MFCTIANLGTSSMLLTFSIETVHHSLDYIQLVLDGEVYEIGVDDDVKRRSQLGVISEKQS